MTSTSVRRALATGGLVGPVAFVGSWVRAGASTPGYSPADQFVSELAATDAATRHRMAAALTTFGLGSIAFGAALREPLGDLAAATGAVAGIATLGIAASPLRPGARNRAHFAWAAVSYAATIGAPLAASRPLARLGRPAAARASALVGVASAALLGASLLAGRRRGLLQRGGLSVVHTWIVATAAATVADRLQPSGR